MTKLTVAIVAAAVGSTEAWGSWWRRPTRNPTAPRGFAGNSKTLKEFGWSAHKHGKIGECKGDCDADYQCATGLKCFHRSSPGTVTGCMGRSVSSYDYCYRPVPTAYPTAYPTAFPTAYPTNPPSVAAHKDAKSLTTHGYNAHNLANVKKHGFGMCQGDCDNDSQCRGAMKCYHSSTHGVSLKFQTGCEGKTLSMHDYCYMPAAPTRFPTRKPTSPPVGTAHVDSKSLKTHGYNAHLLGGVQKHGFGMCQGDCDSDAQCRGSMVCFHSHKAGNTVTGCEGKTLAVHDYCYQPLKLSNPKRCQEWSCTEWCSFFDQATEDAGVYKANGCADDGVDSCQCA